MRDDHEEINTGCCNDRRVKGGDERGLRVTGPCPTPHKVGYHRLYLALIASDRLAYRFESTPYLCPCGRYHLTAQGGRNDHSTEKKRRRRKRDRRRG
jgi:hypothetical protein